MTGFAIVRLLARGTCTTPRRRRSDGIDSLGGADLAARPIRPGFLDERVEKALVLARLGMPEDAERETPGGVLEPLERPVLGPGGLDQAFADPPDTLVVTRLDCRLPCAEHRSQLRALLDLDRMLREHAANLAVPGVADGVRQVLDEVAAAHDVEELEAAADRQRRDVALERGRQQGHLRAV